MSELESQRVHRKRFLRRSTTALWRCRIWPRFVIVGTAALCGAVVIVGVTRAVPQRADLSPRLAVAPAKPISTDVQVALQNLIGPEAAREFGISDQSYADARVLAQTAAGPLYVIPGMNGICVALIQSHLPAAACGDLSARNPIIAVLVPDPSDTVLVGGGVTASARVQAIVRRADGSAVLPTP
jgi:hypothetical protein